MVEEMEGVEDDNTFPQEEIDGKVQEVAEEVLKEAMWDELKVPVWINEICEKTTKSLVDLQRPYKFIVTCVIQQKTGATTHSSHSSHFENTTDGVISIIYPQQSRAKEA